MRQTIQEWTKPAPSQPVVKQLADISGNALSQLVSFMQQFPPQLPGRSVDGASPIDIYQDGVFVATVSAINFVTPPATPPPNIHEVPTLGETNQGTGTGGSGSGSATG